MLFACATDAEPSGDTGKEQLPGDTSVDSDAPDTADSGDTGADTGACGEVGADPEGYAALLDPSIVHAVSLTLNEEAIGALAVEPDAWADAALTLDGRELAAIGVKWRGDSEQMHWEGKPSWSLGFRRSTGCDTLGGMERITLDAMNDDEVQGRIVVEAALLERLGRVAPRATFATLTVNGSPFGLYALVEYVDEHFAANHLGAWAGVVWTGGSGADFTTAGLSAWDDANGEGDAARLQAVADVVQGAGDTFFADLGAIFDTADLASHWAALAAVGDQGTFPYETDDANLLVPDAGLIRLVPDAPESGWNPEFSWNHVDSALGVRCVYDEACAAAVSEALSATIPLLEAAEGGDLARAAFLLSAAELAADPRRDTQVGAVNAARDALAVTIDAWPLTLENK